MDPFWGESNFKLNVKIYGNFSRDFPKNFWCMKFGLMVAYNDPCTRIMMIMSVLHLTCGLV